MIDHRRSAQKSSGSWTLPELARMVRRAKELALFACPKSADRAEPGRQDAVVSSGVSSGRARALCLGERDRLAFERGFNARIEHLNRETESRHGIPIRVCADGPVVEARIADAGDSDGLGSGAVAAEPAAVDDRIAISDLGVGAEHRGR